jgi:capsular exopolysaccharide synthesis family protein
MIDPDTQQAPQTRYLDALRHHWLLVCALVGLAVASAAVYSYTASPRYEAKADILVAPISTGDETFIGINLLREGSESRSVLTAARLTETLQVAERVRDRLSAADSARSLLAAIDVEPQQQSNILTIVATADDPVKAAALANAFAQALLDMRTSAFQEQLEAVVERLERRLDAIPEAGRDSPEAVAISQRLGDLTSVRGADDPTLQIASEASEPSSPVWPRPKLSIAIALLASLLLASGTALALEVVNPRIRAEETLVLEQRLPILARIPLMRQRAIRAFLAGKPLPADVREGYRTLRANLTSASANGSLPRTILVTSSTPGEGKTMTAVNLARTLAQANLRVILIDGDLRRPMVSSFFGVPSHRSTFAGLLLGTTRVKDALIPAPGYGDGMQLVLSTPEHGLLIDLLQTERVERVLADLQAEADVIVIDSPPMTEVADALILADAVEAVVVAVRIGHTGRPQLIQLRRMLAQRGISPAGFVVTTRRRSRRGGYYGTTPAWEPERDAPPQATPRAAPTVRP